ncbi:hypothetical protein [Sphingomonas sp. VL_57B]|uniref:hypothetical protein n=1 Tax=Sphingomonas sp. VL_57B TaxID=3144220 RepID=UPI0031F5B9DB
MTRALTITIGLGLVALLAVLLLLNQCTATRNAKTETRLATGQAGATLVSGSDAATTVGNRMDADAATDQTTRENTNAIRHAEGADAPVSAPVSAAARASLCRRASYRGKPECVQHPDPR